MNSLPILPFLKWPGGKRWAASEIGKIISACLNGRGTYYEPFLGGGAMYFHLRPRRAVLSDINKALIETYAIVRDHPEKLAKAIRRIKVTKTEYYRQRSATPRTPVGRAARFLYLNRTAFAGMYRLNREGQFNVPYGGGQRTPAILWESELLKGASSALKGATLLQDDFETVVNEATRGDVIYCDPTYTVAHDKNCFVRYNERNFSWADQERLVAACNRAVQRGCIAVVSNAHHDSISKLYHGWEKLTLNRKTLINPDTSKRTDVFEYLFVFKPTQ